MVSRCWTFETSVILNQEIADELPYNDYYEYYGPEYRLHIQPSAMENLNQPDTLEKLKTKVFEHMKNWTPVRHRPLPGVAARSGLHRVRVPPEPTPPRSVRPVPASQVPNVQMHVTPADAGASDGEEDDPDERMGQKAVDARVDPTASI